MDKRFKAKLKTADEILGTKGVSMFSNFANQWNYTAEMNGRAKRGEICMCKHSRYDIAPQSFDIIFDDESYCTVHETWLKDIEEVDTEVESKYPEFTEENVDNIIDKCTEYINNFLDDIPNHLPFSDITSIKTYDKKIEDFMNSKKQLALKIVDTLSKMFKSSCCPFCDANTTVGKIIPNFACVVAPDCSKCSYGKYYNKCDNSFSVYYNIRKANEQLREAIEKYWRWE